MATVSEIFGIEHEEAQKISKILHELVVKHQHDEDPNKGIIQEILQEKDRRLREIELFSMGLCMGG